MQRDGFAGPQYLEEERSERKMRCATKQVDHWVGSWLTIF